MLHIIPGGAPTKQPYATRWPRWRCLLVMQSFFGGLDHSAEAREGGQEAIEFLSDTKLFHMMAGSRMTEYLNPLRRVWASGRTAVNGWISAPSVIGAEAMVSAGWDSVTIDLQHGTAEYSDLLSLLPVIEKSGAASVVRVPWVDEAAIMRSLDAGALGIIGPMIETVADAERFVSACRYPPDGGRSFGPIRARLAWGDDYAKRANEEVVALAMIETKPAVESLEEILRVPGLTGIYIGPSDLGSAFGFGPSFDRSEPEMLELMEHIRRSAEEAGLVCCLHCGSPDYALGAANRGMNLVTISSDARFIEFGAKGAVSEFRKSVG